MEQELELRQRRKFKWTDIFKFPLYLGAMFGTWFLALIREVKKPIDITDDALRAAFGALKDRFEKLIAGIVGLMGVLLHVIEFADAYEEYRDGENFGGPEEENLRQNQLIMFFAACGLIFALWLSFAVLPGFPQVPGLEFDHLLFAHYSCLVSIFALKLVKEWRKDVEHQGRIRVHAMVEFLAGCMVLFGITSIIWLPAWELHELFHLSLFAPIIGEFDVSISAAIIIVGVLTASMNEWLRKIEENGSWRDMFIGPEHTEGKGLLGKHKLVTLSIILSLVVVGLDAGNVFGAGSPIPQALFIGVIAMPWFYRTVAEAVTPKPRELRPHVVAALFAAVGVLVPFLVMRFLPQPALFELAFGKGVVLPVSAPMLVMLVSVCVAAGNAWWKSTSFTQSKRNEDELVLVAEENKKGLAKYPKTTLGVGAFLLIGATFSFIDGVSNLFRGAQYVPVGVVAAVVGVGMAFVMKKKIGELWDEYCGNKPGGGGAGHVAAGGKSASTTTYGQQRAAAQMPTRLERRPSGGRSTQGYFDRRDTVADSTVTTYSDGQERDSLLHQVRDSSS